MKKSLFSLFALAIIILACKKENITTKTSGEYLTGHKWATGSITINPANDWYHTGTKITDLFSPLDNCDKDNQFEFDADSTYYTLTGTYKCQTGEVDKISNGKYSISKDQKYITRPDLTVPSLIKEISDTKVVFETTFTDTDHLQYTLTETYQAK